MNAYFLYRARFQEPFPRPPPLIPPGLLRAAKDTGLDVGPHDVPSDVEIDAYELALAGEDEGGAYSAPPSQSQGCPQCPLSLHLNPTSIMGSQWGIQDLGPQDSGHQPLLPQIQESEPRLIPQTHIAHSPLPAAGGLTGSQALPLAGTHKSGGVVILHSLSIAEGLQDGVGLKELPLQLALGLGGKDSISLKAGTCIIAG